MWLRKIARNLSINWIRSLSYRRALAERQASEGTERDLDPGPEARAARKESLAKIQEGVEAILSFVGLSVSSDTPTWGGLIQEGRLYIHQAWWVMALPMGCIIVLVLGLNTLGDGLRQALDPVMRR